jgi:hypothetical protein
MHAAVRASKQAQTSIECPRGVAERATSVLEALLPTADIGATVFVGVDSTAKQLSQYSSNDR